MEISSNEKPSRIKDEFVTVL